MEVDLSVQRRTCLLEIAELFIDLQMETQFLMSL